jgi:hypothetical protein
MEKFEDGLACRIFLNSATAWGIKDASWDALTEDQRQGFHKPYAIQAA